MRLVKIRPKTDYIKYKMKVKHAEQFYDDKYEELAGKYFGIMLLEHPGFNSYEANIESLEYSRWSFLNLKNKGHEVNTIPQDDPDRMISFYCLKSPKAKKKFLRRFSGIADKFDNSRFQDFSTVSTKINIIKKIIDNVIGVTERFKTTRDNIKANLAVARFSLSVPAELQDVFYEDEINFLYQDTFSKFTEKRFNKFINKLDGQTIPYNPKTRV